MDLREYMNSPEFQQMVIEQAAIELERNPFIRALREYERNHNRDRSFRIPYPAEFSKEPFDAEIVIEDILDADLIG